MQYSEFISKFKKQVFALDYKNQLLLAIAICKQLFFDYQLFYETHEWGNPDVLLDAISICEKAVDEEAERSKVEAAIKEIDKVAPDMDDFGDEISTYALNASNAVYETLQFLLDKEPKHIYAAGISLTDTIDFKIQEDADLDEEEINKNPLMIKARRFLIENSKPKGFILTLKGLFKF